ncbi:right-handed parallel beta-helix repeat-containing protein [Rubripirellula reticaptiva]|uniref:PDZ domain-containing protein n=1 Tax=Rubripirellula reticaptiva TaxID=2528013 RepID=A0A5C6EGK1_9BACT|nr:right-handed parallel beta-helix repeat-containing protein [Rubripirellula reticaptiva]TWU46716.1 hypothetical protein Poly59_56890 [Rubripirellula reticaptiva]
MNTIVQRASLSLFIACLSVQALAAAELYVSSSGSDNNDGSKSAPVASIGKAKSLARSFAGNQAVTVHVGDGVYYLPETLVFESADSGSAQNPIVYVADNEGGAVLSGGTKLDLTWRPFRDGILQATTPPNVVIDQLFIDGRNQRMARYPNFDASKTTEAYQGFSADAFAKERVAGWADPVGGYIHAMHRSRWGGYHYRITGKDSAGDVTFEGGWQNNRPSGMHNEFRMVENIFEELDAAGEWFHDAKTRTLYYKPAPGVDLASATVEIVRLRRLIEFSGSEESPVRYITLSGFTIRHAARTFMETKEPLLRSDWAIYRGGAIFLSGTEDISVTDSTFDQVGGNAVFASNYNRRVHVKGCHIHDAGASGVCFVGDPDAVRDPLFGYGAKNDLSKIDRTPGPKTNNYPADSVVEDCLIHGIGRVERQPAGVLIEMAQRVTVRDCSIYDCARAGINIGDGAWGGHLIERCDVFDTVQETHDHGSFNSWGRDRYWRSDHLAATQKAVDASPELPFLDAVETTVIRDSRWRCDHGWDIDLDDGSSNYDIYNNLMLGGGLKLREGFRRRAWNNITVNNGFHPHVWFNHSGDEVFSNIFMAAHRGARMPSDLAKGKRVNENLFFVSDASIKDRFAEFGWDTESIVGDPLFVAPSEGDFRVKPDSPALKIGFKNFPMGQFGVKKPALKSIAKSPTIPVPDSRSKADSDPLPVKADPMQRFWLGAKLRQLSGEEFSAYGSRKEDGGVSLDDVPKTSEAAAAGLRAGDLILSINQQKTPDFKSFFAAVVSLGAAPLELQLVRDQNVMAQSISQHSYVVIESATEPGGFHDVALSAKTLGTVSANQKTRNEPIEILLDGKLAVGFGPVFANGVNSGAYRMDLGQSRPISTVSTWSFANGDRGHQVFTLYGSASADDPGWDVTKYTALATIDTSVVKPDAIRSSMFIATELRSPSGIGKYRWIVWRVSPVTDTAGGENTAFQEFSVQ